MNLSRRSLAFIALAAAVLIAGYVALSVIKPGTKGPSLRVALAPYQDMALLVNHGPLGLDKKYGIDLDLVTVAWGDLVPAVASAGRTVDVSFGGLIEYLNKAHTINAGSADPVLFIFPLYAFKGGALVTFNPKVPDLTHLPIEMAHVEGLFGYRMGFPKYSVIHMLVADVASQVGIPADNVSFVDIPYDDALLASQSGSLDVVGVGLTQRAEALKQSGRVVLNMDNVGFADISGFLVRESTLKSRPEDIEKLIRIWFDCVAFVFSDIDQNARYTLSYLNEKSATNFTLDGFKEALSHEYFPISVEEAQRELIDESGKYSVRRISKSVVEFLVRERLLEKEPPGLDIMQLK